MVVVRPVVQEGRHHGFFHGRFHVIIQSTKLNGALLDIEYHIGRLWNTVSGLPDAAYIHKVFLSRLNREFGIGASRMVASLTNATGTWVCPKKQTFVF